MPPAFPEAERIELKEPPLELVVCQLRFPTVVALAANQPPEELQRRLRTSYPVAGREHTARVEMGFGTAPQTSTSTIWRFEDRASQWTVSLGQDFLALETRSYRRFEEFIERFMGVFGTLRELYTIELRERLGLRYLDRISCERQPQLPPNWPERIRQEMIPLRGLRGPSVTQLGNLEARFAFGDNFLAVRSFFLDNGFAGTPRDELILDFDCYTDQRGELEGIADLLRTFRQHNYNAFRWAMSGLLDCFERAEEGELK